MSEMIAPHPDDNTGRWGSFNPELFGSGFKHFAANYERPLCVMHCKAECGWRVEMESLAEAEATVVPPYCPLCSQGVVLRWNGDKLRKLGVNADPHVTQED